MQIIDQVWKETDDIPYDRVIDVYIKELINWRENEKTKDIP